MELLGYPTIQEASRTLIDEYAAKGASLEELRADGPRFVRMVLQKNIEIEKNAPTEGTIFFDRGIPDCIAYHKLVNLTTVDIEAIGKGRYKRVFFLEQVPFVNDYARPEDEETAAKLSALLLSAYKDLDYNVIMVPAVSVAERVKLVLASL